MRLFLSLAASALAASAVPAAAETVTPLRAADALDRIGVNTHIVYLDTSYANIQQVVTALKYLGITQVRDLSPSPWVGGAAPLSSYVYAMQQGIKFNFVAHCCQAGFGTDVGQTIDLLKQVPGGVTSLEGFNEVDMNPVTWMGQTGPAAAVAAQKNLYASIKGNKTLKSLPVFDLTGVEHNLPDSLAGRADYANTHLYPQNGNQPNAWFKEMGGYAAAKKQPWVVTEFGYAMYPQSGWLMIGVDEGAQARAIANGVLSGIEQGARRTYVYELLDQKPDPQNKQREWHFGLFTNDYKPKAAAVMLSRITGVMKDTSAQAKTFTPHPLSFSISGATATTHWLVVEKGNTTNTRLLWIWNEAPIWDRATGKPISSPPISVKVSLPAGGVPFSYTDPAVQAAPLILYKKASTSVKIDIPDHPVVLEIRGL